MIVNVCTFLFVAALIGAGLWLADTMASLRRNQDCALAGHRNCLRIEDINDLSGGFMRRRWLYALNTRRH